MKRKCKYCQQSIERVFRVITCDDCKKIYQPAKLSLHKDGEETLKPLFPPLEVSRPGYVWATFDKKSETP